MVQLNDGSANIQAHAHTGRFGSKEWVKELRLVLVINAGAVISYFKDNMMVIVQVNCLRAKLFLSFYAHAGFDTVFNQIQKHLFNHNFIAPHIGEIGG